MKRLPNYTNAEIAIEKLAEYCLNDLHPVGKQKAIVFKSALGITVEHASLLKEAIYEGLKHYPSSEKVNDKYGKRYLVKMKLCIFEKEAVVITSWIIKEGEDFARLTTCYIKRK